MTTNKVFETKYKELNSKQKEAVDAIYGPVMVVAGPGTGKTTVLTLRIANILQKGAGAKPEEILALTFTENGARNMREKLREIIGDISFRVNIFTFHAFANHMRSLFPEAFGKTRDGQLSDEVTKLQILESLLRKQSFRELRISTFGVNLKKISGRISDLKRELITPKDLKKLISKEEKFLEDKKMEKHFIRINEFATLFELYEKEKEKRNLYDFDDAITELVQALKSNPDMAAEMRESFQYVLADEHQDANGAQNEILKMFKATGLDAPNVFVVGDDKQSIFRFQGASLEHFYSFGTEFRGAKKIVLMENYRSHKVILDASHSLISKSGNGHQKLSSNVSYKEKKIEIVEYSGYETELNHIAKQVRDILSRSGDRERVAIIARNNKALFDIAPFLDLHKVDYRIAGERSLFEDFEYKKLMNLFEAIINPYEGALLKALYAGYFDSDISEVIALAGKAKKERKDFATLYLAQNIAKPIKELIAKAKTTEVCELLKTLRNEIQNNSHEYNALKAVFDEARELTKKNRGAKLDDLIQHLKFLEAHNLSPLSIEEEQDANVELFSIHRAKGLEFDYVFIIDATAKRFEKSSGRADLLAIPGVGTDTELAEERRLLYVALTRAKKHAVVSYSLVGDEGAENAPSALLAEINNEFVDRKIYKEKEASPDLLGVPKKILDKKVYRDAFLQRNFSVSALNNFIDCPWKYFFRNLLLIPEAPEFASSLGNACHEALRIFHTNAKKGKILNKNELEKLLKQCIYKEPFTESELPVATEKAEKSLLAYASTFKPFSKEEKVNVEDKHSFVYKVKDNNRNFEITITGKIDLLREKSGRTEVIDFKTKKRMTRNEIKGMTKNSDGNEWRQLQFYKFLIEHVEDWLRVDCGTLTFLTPEKGVILSEAFELVDQDKVQIERALSEALLSIYNLDFWNTTCGKKDCEYCTLSKSLPK